MFRCIELIFFIRYTVYVLFVKDSFELSESIWVLWIARQLGWGLFFFIFMRSNVGFLSFSATVSFFSAQEKSYSFHSWHSNSCSSSLFVSAVVERHDSVLKASCKNNICMWGCSHYLQTSETCDKQAAGRKYSSKDGQWDNTSGNIRFSSFPVLYLWI